MFDISIIDTLFIMAAPVRRLSSRFSGVLSKTSWGASTISSTKHNNKPRTYFTYSPEIAQPLQKEPKWTTAEEAVKCIKSGKLLKNINRLRYAFMKRS